MADSNREKAKPVIERFRDICRELVANSSGLTGRKATALRGEITAVLDNLIDLSTNLDPVKQPSSVFDPANPRTVGRFVGLALVAQEKHPLVSIPRFYGSGVYALYYHGDFKPYAPLVRSENPIYVGKYDPVDPSAKTPKDQGERLNGRFKDHARSIRKATTSLDIEDFSFRYLVVQSGWQTAAESYLIHLFRPIWNDEIGICFGVGKHGDDPKTRANKRSPWDTLHPGRDWAHRDPDIKDAKSASRVRSEISAHFKKHQPFLSIDDVLKQFFEDLSQRG